MGGFSQITGDPLGSVMNAFNASFNGTERAGVLLTDGQLWIGHTALNAGGTHIDVGRLTSPDGSVTIGYSSPNITLQAASVFTFIDQGTSITLATNTGYFVTAATTQTLPASPSQGDLVIIDCDTASAVVVTANTGQLIRLGSSVSSSGGTATSTARGDCLTLRYRASGATWQVVSSMGNWTIA